MITLGFSDQDATVEPVAALPTLAFRLQVAEATGQAIHAMLLRYQIRLEARRRAYSADEQARLFDLFGAAGRWGETLTSLAWTQGVVMVPEFQGRVEVSLPVALSYDLEVAAGRYFDALQDGEIPLVFLFSGSVFVKGPTGLQVEQVPWDREAAFRLPVRRWRDAMDRHFPGGGWLRLRRESLEALARFKTRRALLTWDETIMALVDACEAGARR